MKRLWMRLRTMGAVVAHFCTRGRFFLLPLVIVIALASVLLALTGGISYVAPFVYALF